MQKNWTKIKPKVSEVCLHIATVIFWGGGAYMQVIYAWVNYTLVLFKIIYVCFARGIIFIIMKFIQLLYKCMLEKKYWSWNWLWGILSITYLCISFVDTILMEHLLCAIFRWILMFWITDIIQRSPHQKSRRRWGIFHDSRHQRKSVLLWLSWVRPVR